MFLAGKRKLVHVLRTLGLTYVIHVTVPLLARSASRTWILHRVWCAHHKAVVQPTTEILIITSTLDADRVTHNLAIQLNRAIVSSSLLTTHVYNRAADICSPRMCMHMEIVEDITRILRVLVEEFERWRFNFRRAWVRRLKALWRMRNSLSCSVLHDINLIVGCWHDDGFSYFFFLYFWKILLIRLD